MRVKVNISQPEIKVNETFSGKTPEEVVAAMRARVAKEMPFLMRPIVNSMSALAFAQEVVKRYNASSKKNLPPPKSCQEFLTLAQVEGFAEEDLSTN